MLEVFRVRELFYGVGTVYCFSLGRAGVAVMDSIRVLCKRIVLVYFCCVGIKVSVVRFFDYFKENLEI